MSYIISILFNILTSGLPCCLLAMGIFITYRILDFADLTAEGSFLIGGSISLALIYIGVNPILATLCAFFAGSLCGFLTGILNRKLRIPKLLSGIITLTATASISLIIIGISKEGQFFSNLVTLKNTDKTIYSMFYGNNGTMNTIIETIVMIVIVLIVFFIMYYFFGTEYGMTIRATGINSKMARAQGINTTTTTSFAVSLSNGLIGLAGSLYAQDARSIDIKSASGYLVIGLASILIGEAIFGKKDFKNTLISINLGAICYFIIISVAIALGFPTQLKNLLYAILIAIALCLPLFKELINKTHKGGQYVGD